MPFAHINREKETQVLQRKTELLSNKKLLAVSCANGATIAVNHTGPTELWFQDLNFSSSLVCRTGPVLRVSVSLCSEILQYMSFCRLQNTNVFPEIMFCICDCSSSHKLFKNSDK